MDFSLVKSDRLLDTICGPTMHAHRAKHCHRCLELFPRPLFLAYFRRECELCFSAVR